MRFTISIDGSDDRFTCREGQNVLNAMEKMGRRGIPVGCRGGGCGICRVQIVHGADYSTGKMSRAQVSEADQAAGICLACKLFPAGDMTLKPLGVLRTRLIQYTDTNKPFNGSADGA